MSSTPFPDQTPSRPGWRLTVRDEFAASHSLRNYGGKCEALHGHNFGVEVCIEGYTLDKDIHYLVDFGIIKKQLKQVLSLLDHKHLNETPPFDEQNPSSENLARFIFQQLAPMVAEHDVRLAWVTVSERAIQSATYWE